VCEMKLGTGEGEVISELDWNTLETTILWGRRVLELISSIDYCKGKVYVLI